MMSHHITFSSSKDATSTLKPKIYTKLRTIHENRFSEDQECPQCDPSMNSDADSSLDPVRKRLERPLKSLANGISCAFFASLKQLSCVHIDTIDDLNTVRMESPKVGRNI
uniref:Uncharacterized protein n=1 Tax=Kalanchoe fedtschenkoi TaxID=63787 RepID=A0A7N0TNE3_KALFE